MPIPWWWCPTCQSRDNVYSIEDMPDRCPICGLHVVQHTHGLPPEEDIQDWEGNCDDVVS